MPLVRFDVATGVAIHVNASTTHESAKRSDGVALFAVDGRRHLARPVAKVGPSTPAAMAKLREALPLAPLARECAGLGARPTHASCAGCHVGQPDSDRVLSRLLNAFRGGASMHIILVLDLISTTRRRSNAPVGNARFRRQRFSAVAHE